VIPSIDYLTLVLAGSILFYVGVDSLDDGDSRIVHWLALACAVIGVVLFTIGATSALMGALGL